MEVGDKTYVGFGWEAVTWPFFATSLQPSLAFSNFVFAFQDEAVSQIVHDAYVRLNAKAVRKTRVSGSIIDTLSDVQLYFINLAQTLLIQRAKYDATTLFDDNDKIWKLFKCLRPFSNAFKCEPGTKYYQVEECRVLKGNIFPNYNLSYYGHDAVKRFFMN
ncbi:unnamed protein product [Bursaphelenchus xylophilus]|nr:unnamed protein product [Bursaphelenchus xylophilus]CAG9120981.1 unnamed protein product [Bursaphelenchus xylophilus]